MTFFCYCLWLYYMTIVWSKFLDREILVLSSLMSGGIIWLHFICLHCIVNGCAHEYLTPTIHFENMDDKTLPLLLSFLYRKVSEKFLWNNLTYIFDIKLLYFSKTKLKSNFINFLSFCLNRTVLLIKNRPLVHNYYIKRVNLRQD